MPGAPFIYYGDEIGMRYVENLISVEGGYGRTGSRSPMQWDNGVNAGFSTAASDKLYISTDPAADRPTVQAQMNDESSLYSEIKRLIRIRREHPALLSRGEIEFVYAKKNEYPLAYIRSVENEKILVVINPAAREAAFGGNFSVAGCIYSFGTEAKIGEGNVLAAPMSAGFYSLK